MQKQNSSFNSFQIKYEETNLDIYPDIQRSMADMVRKINYQKMPDIRFRK